MLASPRFLQNVVWLIDDYSFTSNLKILPLTHFDVILGMDWLEKHSPMQIHWKSKWLQFQYHGSQITLQGLSPLHSDKLLLQVCYVTTEQQSSNIALLPAEL